MWVPRSRHLGNIRTITAVPRSISASAASAQKLQKAYSHNYVGAGLVLYDVAQSYILALKLNTFCSGYF